MNLTSKHRARVIADILSWKTEEKQADGDVLTDDEFDEWVTMLDDKQDAELQKSWQSLVGEWVLSRNDIDIPDGVPVDEWLAGQFEAVMTGRKQQWGYVAPVSTAAVEAAL